MQEVVFQRLRQTNLKLKPKKCVLFQRKVAKEKSAFVVRGLSMDSQALWVAQCTGDVWKDDGEHYERAAMGSLLVYVDDYIVISKTIDD